MALTITVKADLVLPGTQVNICGRILVARNASNETLVTEIKNLLLLLTLDHIRNYIDRLLSKRAVASLEEISEWVRRPTADQVRIADALRHANEICKPNYDSLLPFSS